MRGWQANLKAHLCAASNIRAMPETEIPPATRGDNYCYELASLSTDTFFRLVNLRKRGEHVLITGNVCIEDVAVYFRCFECGVSH